VSDPASPPRAVPDFVILGAMKAGTTTAFRRILAHPGVADVNDKEPNFFSRDENWRRGVDWYERTVFAGEGLRGEASVEYGDPANIATVVERLLRTSPDVRMLFIARHPVDRLRSHYRHQVERSRERRSLAEALANDTFGYVRRSLYSPTIAAVHAAAPADRLLVLDTDELDDANTWVTIWHHLELPAVDVDGARHNVAATKAAFTPAALALWERGWLKRAGRLPKPVRRLGRRVLMRNDDERHRLLAASEADVPPHVLAELEADAARFLTMVGWPADHWEFSREAGNR
jgi:hypothetical protein